MYWQIFEEEWGPAFNYTPSLELEYHSNSEQDTTLSTVSDSSGKLSWDDSPVQISLQEQEDHNVSLPAELSNQAYQSRRLATSDPILTRSDAFRTPADEKNQHLLCTSHRTRVLRRSRIPWPTSPSQVILDQVADLSVALDPLVTPEQPPPAVNQAPVRRKTKQPSNYKKFASTGQK